MLIPKQDSWFTLKPEEDSKMTLFLIPVQYAVVLGIFIFFAIYLLLPIQEIPLENKFAVAGFLVGLATILFLPFKFSINRYLKKHKVKNSKEIHKKMSVLLLKMYLVTIPLAILLGLIVTIAIPVQLSILSFILMAICIPMLLMYTTVIAHRNSIMISYNLKK